MMMEVSENDDGGNLYRTQSFDYHQKMKGICCTRRQVGRGLTLASLLMLLNFRNLALVEREAHRQT